MKRLFALTLLISVLTPVIGAAQDAPFDGAATAAPGRINRPDRPLHVPRGLQAPADPGAAHRQPSGPRMHDQRDWLPAASPSYNDPKAAVRRKAEIRSAQRRARIARQKWYGYSPLRPAASPMPFMGSYANWSETVVGQPHYEYYWVTARQPFGFWRYW